MIFQSTENCARVLFSLNIPRADVSEAETVWNESGELREALCCPAVGLGEKYAVTDRLFPSSMTSFIKTMCAFGHIAQLSDIFKAYRKLELKKQGIVEATLYCADRPDNETAEKFRKMLCEKYGANDAALEITEDKSLIIGYRLVVGDTEYDKSAAGAVKALRRKLVCR
ncbi:F0F1 ATP synthase subunit delta [Ruminococcus sp. Marseille-P6503]|uniref:F0F1 ATP synthase subunit delta n=1 Tax=Ruminococcus sp. Marseille-P6503 TaxID=2364796 RepID=UPI000F52A615|nr:F0F1 ATP synthase subunit delta [Ruminococcus sp. Marseille-P6503]